jgi:hypothetical protein
VGCGKGGAGQWVPMGEVHDVGEIELGPAQRGGGAAGGSRAAVWAAAGGVADCAWATAWVAAGGVAGSCVGNSRRRCGPPR